jgi:hypothetical protein
MFKFQNVYTIVLAYLSSENCDWLFLSLIMAGVLS